MGGIIQGFLGGAAQGMADAGKMLLADKLSKERDESSFLRDSEFRRTERLSGQEYSAGESAEDRKNRLAIAKIGAESRIKAAGIGKGGSLTAQQKNVADLVGKGYNMEDAVAIVHPGATIKHTDPEGNQIVVVRGVDGEREVGRITINDTGNQEWVEAGETTVQTKPTKKQLKAKAKQMNKESGADDDLVPFNELGPKDQKVREAAQADIDAGVKPGIVAGQSGGDTKMVGQREMTKAAFVDAMVKKYGQGAMAEIEETWNSIK